MSSLLARSCPLHEVSDPLWGAGSDPLPSSPDGISAANLVNPERKGHVLRLGDGVLALVL